MKKKRSLSYLRLIFSVKLPWVLILLSALFSIAYGSSELEIATMTGSIIDGTKNAIVASELLGYIRASAVYAVFCVLSTYFTGKTQEVITLRVRVKLWNKIMGLPMAYYDRDNGNELVSRVTSDASAPGTLFEIAVVCVTSVITVIRAFVQLYRTNTVLANYSLIMVPVILLVFALYSVLQFRLGAYSTKVTATSLGYLAERVRNFRLIKAAVTERVEAKKGSWAFGRMYIADFLEWLSVAAYQVISNLTSIIFIIIVFVIGGQLVPAGELTVGDLTSFYMITGIVSMHLGLFFINAGSLFSALGTMDKIARILDTPEEPSAGKEVPTENRDITFCSVRFSYDGSHEALKGLDLTLPAGKVTAVIGGNGAGKSTLFKLLTRLYGPNSGEIRFGDEDISRFDLTGWRDCFAYVFQKDPLMGGTVRENLTYGLDREVTDDELEAVCRRANCWGCIREKPGGLDADVGLNGSNFSGGQGQCISIARAMLRNAPILLLDEATSNLDVVSEAKVTAALNALMAGRTTVMIAHSWAATRNADYVVVLRSGQVEAAGTPEELVKTNDYYRTFANSL